jgi:cysteinyl-tRNA synthetase
MDKTKDIRIQTKTGSFVEIENIRDRFIKSMDDDFNTSEALAAIFELLSISNKNMGNEGFIFKARKTLEELFGLLGIDLNLIRNSEGLSDEEIEVKIKERLKAKQEKDYRLSDKIREELEEKGIILEDKAGGATSWRRRL